MSKDFILKTVRNFEITITSYGEENFSNSPCIVCVHGFKGFKDWGFWPYTAEYLSGKGFFVLTFNFSHNGIGNSLTEFTEVEKFAENTPSLEIEELNEIINAYQNGFFGDPGKQKIGLLGHSRGGGITLLTARQNKNINAIAVWASISKFDRYTERQKEVWRKAGVFEVLNTRTNQLMKLNIGLLEDIEQNKNDSLNIQQAVSNLDRPLLILHGEQDLTVPVSEADKLYSWSDKKRTILQKIPAAGHTFDAIHPFAGTNQKLSKVLTLTEEFFNNNLS